MIQWQLQPRKLKDLKKHPKNPRKLTREQYDHLKNSLDKFGYIDKIVINVDGTIMGGHQRYEILKREKISSVECWVPDRLLEDKETEQLLIRLNRNHGEFDYEILANEFEVPELLDWGFHVDELQLRETEDVQSDEKTNKKKLTSCPNCGHKF